MGGGRIRDLHLVLGLVLAQPFKSGRRGLLLNPGDIDGDSLLSTSLGRISTDFIPGRGYIVGRGKVRKLQVALPPENRN